MKGFKSLGIPLAAADVASDLRGANDATFGVLDRRHRQGDVDQLSVFASS
jgi:hypothetical protein